MVGDTCTYEGKWYKCKVDMSIGHAWTESEWDEMPTVKQFIDGALEGKLDKSGGVNLRNDPRVPGSFIIQSTTSGGLKELSFRDDVASGQAWKLVTTGSDPDTEVRIPIGPGALALTAGTGHTGNLAALDAQGNPTDSGKSFEDIQHQIDTESPLLARSFSVQQQSGWTVNQGSSSNPIFFRPRFFGMKDGDLFKGMVLRTRSSGRTPFPSGVYMRVKRYSDGQTLGVSELTVWPDTASTDVVFRFPVAVELTSSGNYYTLDFSETPEGSAVNFGMSLYALPSGSTNTDFYFASSSNVPISTAQFYSWEELTGADIAVSGTDATKIDVALAGKASTADATLTPVYSDTPTFSEWSFNPATDSNGHPYSATKNGMEYTLFANGEVVAVTENYSNATMVSWVIDTSIITTATRTRTDIIGYQLGSQTDKQIAAADPFLFARYYPDGSVKSAAEFTPGIKYDTPNTTNHTITVKPFCNTGDSDNDNSNLSGRVVIPPFVDGDGNPYISDDGTRYKVVGVGSGTDSNNSNENLTAVIAPSTVTNIGDKAFRRCTKLASISTTAATSIGSGAFNTCTSLASVSLPAVDSIGTYAFNSCTKLASVSIPAATNIKNYAFYSCNKLTSVSIPAAKSIGGHVFDACTALASVSLPATTSVGGSAFNNCNSLASVSLPVVTSIDGYSFAGCTSLTSVDFGETLSSVPELGGNAFSSVPTSCKIIVPDAQYDAWTSASGWSSLVTRGYKFLKHSEWEYARKYEVATKADASDLLAKLNSTSAAPEWVSGTDYTENALVYYNGVVYRCKANTVSPHTATPDEDTTHWEAKPVSDLFLPLTGGTMTGNPRVPWITFTGGGGVAGFGYSSVNNGFQFDVDGVGSVLIRPNASQLVELNAPKTSGTLALTAGEGHNGNLATLDEQGNPIDSQIAKDDIVTKEELEEGVTTDVIEASGITIDGKQCATKDLVGQEFDFSTTQGFMDAIAACVRALGGTVINNPSEQNQGGN